jgi:acyl-CoA reductase-like NAD-dependent aldehyde dehydrogenase
MYVGGQWKDSAETKDVLDKYTGEKTATCAVSSQEDVDEAVAFCRQSLRKNALTPAQRAAVLRKAGDLLLARTDEFAYDICREAGRLIGDAKGEVTRSKLVFDLAAEEAGRIAGEMVPVDGMAGNENKICFTLRVPVGVVCCITPFNVPLSLTVHKVLPAIAAGNAVVLKPASDTPGFAVKLVETLLEAGLPAGHISLVLGGGDTVGEMLLKNQDINFYSFTGSLAVGEHIKNTIGLRRCSMELGSNAACIVHKDAGDIKKIAGMVGGKAYANAGQVCMRPQRIFVHEDVYNEFVEHSKAFAESLKVGSPYEADTKVGPMISVKEVDRVEAWIQEAIDEGAALVCGGKRQGERNYMPTVLTDVKDSMKVVGRELFGPAIVIIPYSDFDEAISRANDSIYGLQTGVFTQNLNLAMKAAKEIEAGGIIINETPFTRVDTMPYGGIKKSSAGGKEGPKYVIEEMTDVKTILINL